MEGVAQLDRASAMPSQSQMPYSRAPPFHPPIQNQERDVVRGFSKSSPGQPIPASTAHNSGSQYPTVGSSNYSPMRYIHPAPYAPPPGATPIPPFRENLYPPARSSTTLTNERAQSVDFMRNEQIKPRISLLPSSEYLSLSRNRLLQSDGYREPMGGPSPQSTDVPLKKIRIGETKSDVQRNLRVETRDDTPPASTYNPQVEAISPTLPPEALQEDSNFRSTKDDLLHGIAKVDREITKTELQISKLKRKQQELEEAAKKPAVAKEEEEVPQPKHQSPAQKIYAENRKKAHDAHMLLANLGPKIYLPLYNQPSDTTVYHDNKKKHIIFRSRLLEHLRRKHIERENRERRLTTTYSKMVQDWLKKVEKIENSQKRKAREAKNRDYFEKIFPKLRKQREDRERFNRVGARVKSEADIEEIMDGLQEQEMEEKKMRSYAVVPPLLLDARQRSVYYINNNGRLDDFAADYKEKQLLNVWTQSEKELFKEKFLQHPKNFGMIASYLERKSVGDCVQYYYLSKKTENYKRLLRKSRHRPRSRNPQSKVTSGPGSNSNLEILGSVSGVTTRLQREQLQKQEPLSTSVPVECDSNHTSYLLQNSQTQQLFMSSDQQNQEKKKEEENEEKKKNEEEESSTDEEPAEQSLGSDMENLSGVTCAVCKGESGCFRALPRSQASQYGLKEEEVPNDARVCNLCRCKAVRSRFTNCPVPTCQNVKGHRIKRLRPLPYKWFELTSTIKEPIAVEFQIDDSVTKCCSVCFNRISRRISVALDNGNSGNDEAQLSPSQCNTLFSIWSDDEIDSLKNALKTHGLNWPEIAAAVGKTQHQCMTFYYNHQEKYGLALITSEQKSNEEERKPVLTDEEESGSSTSSCDEVGTTGVADPAVDSDTTSAPSPLPNQGSSDNLLSNEVEKLREMSLTMTPPPQMSEEGGERNANEQTESASSPQPKSSTPSLPPTLYPAKEDYDSSATETADEGQGGGESESSSAVRSSTPKQEEDPSSPLTVKDLMLGVIEMQLMKNQTGQVQSCSTPGGAPTISSILKSDHHSIGGYASQREKATRHLDINRDSLATVSVVNPHHTHQPLQQVPKEGLVVVQVQQTMREAREPEGVTLDLSIKKPRDSPPPIPVAKVHHQVPPQGNVFRVAPPPEQQGYYQMYPYWARGFYEVPRERKVQRRRKRRQCTHLAPPLAPKLSPGVISGSGPGGGPPKPQCGSIIHGTPVSSPNIYGQPRYEPPPPPSLIHQVSSQHKESGSITQGTPVHQRTSLYSNPEYYPKRNIPQPTGYYSSPRPSSYNVEQRQIIMNDYITSQQMHGAGNSSGPRSSRDKMYYQPNTRQGVIQRHNTKPPSPGVSHYPPGHEAFSSLVDVAVRQPSLPVPPINMSHEHKSMQEEKRHLHEGLGERFNRDSPHDRYSSREAERYMRDPHTGKSHSQQQPPSREPQPTREPVSHVSRESYQQSQHHLDREAQMQRERDHREREHHNQSQKLRESQMAHMDMRRSQMAGYQPRLMHESHHPMDQRLLQTPSYREPPSSQPSSSLPSRHSSQEQSDSPSSRGRCAENSTLTAASLIDAIITHQINQSSEGQSTSSVPSGAASAPQSQPTRPGDRLFQKPTLDWRNNYSSSKDYKSFHRECTESNGKLSPAKSDPPKSHVTPMQPPIMEHVDMYNNPSASQGMRPGSMYQGYDHQTWKLRRALQQKEEQGQVLDKNDDHMARFYQDATVPLSPLDYVKNRIAEVMRTSEEDSGNKECLSPPVVVDNICESEALGGGPPGGATHASVAQFIQPTHTYAYPFSALSLNTSVSSSVPPLVPPPIHPIPKNTEPIPEPAPLLSAQYEPLSDED